MRMKIAERVTPAIAHVLPLAAFMVITSVPSFVRIANPLLPWWRHAPEQWVYPLQTLLIGALLVVLWSHYSFKPMRGFFLAALLGLAGIVFWFAPAWYYQTLVADGVKPSPWWEWLGMTSRLEGFDPSFFREHTFWYVSALAMRFARMVIIVPLVEELFWRGFLMRFIAGGGQKPFQQVPFGTHTWPAFAITTLAVMLAHSTPDYLGAFVFGSLMYWLAVRTKSLAACVFMHAVANLILGIYVLKTGEWGFW
jgi:CAAX prenyl protease-like protein